MSKTASKIPLAIKRLANRNNRQVKDNVTKETSGSKVLVCEERGGVKSKEANAEGASNCELCEGGGNAAAGVGDGFCGNPLEFLSTIEVNAIAPRNTDSSKSKASASSENAYKQEISVTRTIEGDKRNRNELVHEESVHIKGNNAMHREIDEFIELKPPEIAHGNNALGPEEAILLQHEEKRHSTDYTATGACLKKPEGSYLSRDNENKARNFKPKNKTKNCVDVKARISVNERKSVSAEKPLKDGQKPRTSFKRQPSLEDESDVTVIHKCVKFKGVTAEKSTKVAVERLDANAGLHSKCATIKERIDADARMDEESHTLGNLIAIVEREMPEETQRYVEEGSFDDLQCNLKEVSFDDLQCNLKEGSFDDLQCNLKEGSFDDLQSHLKESASVLEVESSCTLQYVEVGQNESTAIAEEDGKRRELNYTNKDEYSLSIEECETLAKNEEMVLPMRWQKTDCVEESTRQKRCKRTLEERDSLSEISLEELQMKAANEVNIETNSEENSLNNERNTSDSLDLSTRNSEENALDGCNLSQKCSEQTASIQEDSSKYKPRVVSPSSGDRTKQKGEDYVCPEEGTRRKCRKIAHIVENAPPILDVQWTNRVFFNEAEESSSSFPLSERNDAKVKDAIAANSEKTLNPALENEDTSCMLHLEDSNNTNPSLEDDEKAIDTIYEIEDDESIVSNGEYSSNVVLNEEERIQDTNVINGDEPGTEVNETVENTRSVDVGQQFPTPVYYALEINGTVSAVGNMLEGLSENVLTDEVKLSENSSPTDEANSSINSPRTDEVNLSVTSPPTDKKTSNGDQTNLVVQNENRETIEERLNTKLAEVLNDAVTERGQTAKKLDGSKKKRQFRRRVNKGIRRTEALGNILAKMNAVGVETTKKKPVTQLSETIKVGNVAVTTIHPTNDNVKDVINTPGSADGSSVDVLKDLGICDNAPNVDGMKEVFNELNNTANHSEIFEGVMRVLVKYGDVARIKDVLSNNAHEETTPKIVETPVKTQALGNVEAPTIIEDRAKKVGIDSVDSEEAKDVLLAVRSQCLVKYEDDLAGFFEKLKDFERSCLKSADLINNMVLSRCYHNGQQQQQSLTDHGCDNETVKTNASDQQNENQSLNKDQPMNEIAREMISDNNDEQQQLPIDKNDSPEMGTVERDRFRVLFDFLDDVRNDRDGRAEFCDALEDTMRTWLNRKCSLELSSLQQDTKKECDYAKSQEEIQMVESSNFQDGQQADHAIYEIVPLDSFELYHQVDDYQEEVEEVRSQLHNTVNVKVSFSGILETDCDSQSRESAFTALENEYNGAGENCASFGDELLRDGFDYDQTRDVLYNEACDENVGVEESQSYAEESLTLEESFGADREYFSSDLNDSKIHRVERIDSGLSERGRSRKTRSHRKRNAVRKLKGRHFTAVLSLKSSRPKTSDGFRRVVVVETNYDLKERVVRVLRNVRDFFGQDDDGIAEDSTYFKRNAENGRDVKTLEDLLRLLLNVRRSRKSTECVGDVYKKPNEERIGINGFQGSSYRLRERELVTLEDLVEVLGKNNDQHKAKVEYTPRSSDNSVLEVECNYKRCEEGKHRSEYSKTERSEWDTMNDVGYTDTVDDTRRFGSFEDKWLEIAGERVNKEPTYYSQRQNDVQQIIIEGHPLSRNMIESNHIMVKKIRKEEDNLNANKFGYFYTDIKNNSNWIYNRAKETKTTPRIDHLKSNSFDYLKSKSESWTVASSTTSDASCDNHSGNTEMRNSPRASFQGNREHSQQYVISNGGRQFENENDGGYLQTLKQVFRQEESDDSASVQCPVRGCYKIDVKTKVERPKKTADDAFKVRNSRVELKRTKLDYAEGIKSRRVSEPVKYGNKEKGDMRKAQNANASNWFYGNGAGQFNSGTGNSSEVHRNQEYFRSNSYNTRNNSNNTPAFLQSGRETNNNLGQYYTSSELYTSDENTDKANADSSYCMLPNGDVFRKTSSGNAFVYVPATEAQHPFNGGRFKRSAEIRKRLRRFDGRDTLEKLSDLSNNTNFRFNRRKYLYKEVIPEENMESFPEIKIDTYTK